MNRSCSTWPIHYAPLVRYATENGDGTGAIDFVGNYSVTAVTPQVVCQPTEYLALWRMIVHIGYTGSGRADRYGSVAALTNGIRIQVVQGGTTRDLDGGTAVLDLGDWSAQCYDLALAEFGAGTNFAAVRWSFNRDDGAPLVLRPGESLRLTLNDDFSVLGLVEHRFRVAGSDLAVSL